MSKRSTKVSWENVARAFIDWKRIAILELLAMDGGRTLSVKELGEELQVSTPVASYHVGELRRAGLVELKREEPVRGAIEHFYGLARRG